MLKKVSYFTHQGPYLHINEDLVDSDVDLNLFTIFDGFGGSNVGDVASQTAKDQLKRGFTKISADEDSTMPFIYSARYVLETNALMNAFHQSHQALLKSNQNKKIENRGGSSACALALSSKIVAVVNCGNTNAFIKRGNEFKPLIPSDNFQLVSAVKEQQKNLTTLPTMALGLFEELQMHVTEFLPQKGDVVLLATDGLVSMLPESQIREIIDQDLDDVQLLQKLAEINNDFGNWDNQSGIILRF